MRKTLCVLFAAFAAIGAPTVAYASSSTPVIYVENVSTTVPQVDVVAALPAFQIAVSRDLANAWGTDAILTTDPLVASDMVVSIQDRPLIDCGCLGYHEVIGGKPTSYVFAETGAYFHESWQLTFTHELFEMVVDPWINHFALWHQRTWLVEVGDPCESGFYAYTINGVVISDFIWPKWYNSRLHGRYDQAGFFKRAGQIGRHGYASYWRNNQWQQVFG